MRAITAAVALSLAAVVAADYQWVTRNFQSKSCTVATVAADCGALEELWGEDVCCATVVVRNTTANTQLSSSLQCYPRYHARYFPYMNASSISVNVTCSSTNHDDTYETCTSEDSCSTPGECCMQQATLFRGSWFNITTKTCEDKNYTLFGQVDNHYPLNTNANSTAYFWCDPATNPKAYALAMGADYFTKVILVAFTAVIALFAY